MPNSKLTFTNVNSIVIFLGTGHGIGHFLNVHEVIYLLDNAKSKTGRNIKQRNFKELWIFLISWFQGPIGIGMYRAMPDDPGLQENMFVSNEPGYYEKGQFGIRIEDIVRIVPAKSEHDFNGRGALTFKTVTMCPIHTKLINKSLLTENEVHKSITD